jgi:acetamidase/formamidase
VPTEKEHVPPELADVHVRNERMLPGHILTGPIAVEGAEPGDVFEVDILDVGLRQDWEVQLIPPLAGRMGFYPSFQPTSATKLS